MSPLGCRRRDQKFNAEIEVSAVYTVFFTCVTNGTQRVGSSKKLFSVAGLRSRQAQNEQTKDVLTVVPPLFGGTAMTSAVRHCIFFFGHGLR